MEAWQIVLCLLVGAAFGWAGCLAFVELRPPKVRELDVAALDKYVQRAKRGRRSRA